MTNIVGIAANTRLASYLADTRPDLSWGANALIYVAGLDPRWRQDEFPYQAAEIFPFLFDSGANVLPPPAIVNNSYTFPVGVTAEAEDALQRITLFGRGLPTDSRPMTTPKVLRPAENPGSARNEQHSNQQHHARATSTG